MRVARKVRDIKYIGLSTEAIDKLKHLKGAIDVFFELAKIGMANSRQTVLMTPYIRKMICENCNIKLNTQAKAMKVLLDNDMIRRIARCEYIINPAMVALDDITTELFEKYNKIPLVSQ